MRLHRIAAALAALALILAMGLAAPQARAQLPNTKVIGTGGLGDASNDYAWSMAWFKGKLYVGTARDQMCVEDATLQFYYPQFSWYTARPEPAISCAANMYDLDLRAEVWQYTPQTDGWKLVYRAPADIPNPRAPGRFVARDIGYRGMVVYNGALYIGGVTADEYIPELAGKYPPRILRTTDGRTFTTLHGAPDTIHNAVGVQHPIGYRAMVVYDGKLYVTASGGLTGDGVIVEVGSPASSAPTFKQVSDPSLDVFELATFSGALYAGTGDATLGYGVYRGVPVGDGLAFLPVVTGGAGRGPTVTSVVSMRSFKGRLYVGASGWYQSLLPASELIRIAPDGSWDVVVGNLRAVDGAIKAPISGLGDGYGNIFNAHFWRMQDYRGALFLGTNDWSWSLRDVPILGDWLKPEFGFDLYGSCDGQYWWTATRNAFGHSVFDFGVRTMVTANGAGYIGTTNHAQGTTVFRSTDAPPCQGATAAGAGAQTPSKLLADVQRRGTVLSWDGTRGVTYRVLRAPYRVIRGVSIPAPVGGGVPVVPPAGTPRVRANVPAAGQYATIATTTARHFVDRTAKPGARYAYRVVASGERTPSNTVDVPAQRPRVTFSEAAAALRGLSPAAERRLAVARRRWSRGDRSGALRLLDRLAGVNGVQASASAVGKAAEGQDAADTVMRLVRRLRYSGIAGG